MLPFLFSECHLLRAACVRISSPRGTAAIMCLAPLNVRSTMSVLQDRQLQDGGETGFVFSLMEISHLFLLHHHVGLRSGLVNNPIPFAGVFIFSARRKQDAHFSPCTGKGEGRQMYKAPSGKQCLLLQSLLAADRQPQLSPLKLQSAENKQAAAYSRVPADYFFPHLYCHFIFRLFHYFFFAQLTTILECKTTAVEVVLHLVEFSKGLALNPTTGGHKSPMPSAGRGVGAWGLPGELTLGE